jgi:autophagy-related protein 18
VLRWQRETRVCELSFKTAVLAVKMNRKRLVVVLENGMHIYDITIMKLLHSVETPPNPKGAVCRPCRPWRSRNVGQGSAPMARC